VRRGGAASSGDTSDGIASSCDAGAVTFSADADPTDEDPDGIVVGSDEEMRECKYESTVISSRDTGS
jgi:hypothetical protein